MHQGKWHHAYIPAEDSTLSQLQLHIIKYSQYMYDIRNYEALKARQHITNTRMHIKYHRHVLSQWDGKMSHQVITTKQYIYHSDNTYHLNLVFPFPSPTTRYLHWRILGAHCTVLGLQHKDRVLLMTVYHAEGQAAVECSRQTGWYEAYQSALLCTTLNSSTTNRCYQSQKQHTISRYH